ncbi:MAG: thioether cross-link-forming SCIFF peptide maturase [Oscillospiraceae bacterium]|nr:thioether cross-link-forming SCIFF peptide maturase [Oscillospiraceae bacterium]
MIHKFKQKGHHIVIDVNSGAVHAVDKLLFLLLDHVTPPLFELPEKTAIDGYSGAEILEALLDIRELYGIGQLYSDDDYEKYAENMVLSPIKAMCLNVSHDCNLRCEYCFAETGDYAQGRAVMSAETGKAAIDFLISHSKDRQNLEVDFFGGEPLLNFDAVKEIVSHARSKEKAHNKNFRFTITTNGLLLDDEKIDYINAEMENVVLSLDGRRGVNDRVRRRADGSGSYGDVLPKLQKLVAKRGGKDYYVRGTFTKYNMDFSDDVAALHKLGFDQISIEPVVAPKQMPYALTGEDLPRIFDEYEKLRDVLVNEKRAGNGYNFFHFMLDLDQGPCVIKRLRGCGCGNEYVAVTPDGGIYPCHQFIGYDGWRMGSVHDQSFDLGMKDMFSKISVYQKDECKTCWAKFYCSGGCSANNMRYEGDVKKPVKLTCDIEKKRLECAIAMKAELAEDSPVVV